MKVPIERNRAFYFVAFLWIINTVLRFSFGAMSTQKSLLDVEVSYLVNEFIVVMFFILGFLGLITSFGFVTGEQWGVFGVMLTSILTIIFDTWGITIQFTAALGFIVPGITLIFLTPRMYKMEKLGHLNGSEDE
jgi:hypothetical protein